MATPHRAGFVALVGRPNVGKSTLLNRLVGEKMAIVSPRPQTTRTRITGIRHLPGAQIIFVDTPGLHAGAGRLGQLMSKAADRAVEDVDLACFVAEATEDPARLDRDALDRLKACRAPVYCCLNKTDLVSPKARLLPLIAAYRVAYRLLGNEADALDAVQEGFVKALTHLDGFQGRVQVERRIRPTSALAANPATPLAESVALLGKEHATGLILARLCDANIGRNRNAVSGNPRKALPGHFGIGVFQRRDNTGNPGGNDGVGAGPRLAVMRAGLEADLDRGAAGGLARPLQSLRLGVRTAARLRPAAAEDDAVFHHHRADRRIGPGIAEPAAPKRERKLHESLVFRRIASRHRRGLIVIPGRPIKREPGMTRRTGHLRTVVAGLPPSSSPDNSSTAAVKSLASRKLR